MTKILIIEDNELARENINDILELEGFETLVAKHGQQGLELAKQHTPDLIICDVMMPKLNGYEVLEALGKDEDLVGVPFIFLTAKSTQHDFRHGMTLGSNDYLTKPFSPSELVVAVRTQLKKKNAIAQSYMQKINKLQHSINELAQIDSLTQLPNQTLLSQILEQCSGSKRLLSLFVISVDQLSFLSKALGSNNCDALIKLIAQRIEKIFPSSKYAENLKHIFRIEYSQFVILIDQANQPNYSLPKTSQRLISSLRSPYILNNQAINVTFSIGIASTTSIEGNNSQPSLPKDLLQDAEIALCKVQQKGGNGYHFYCSEISLNVSEKLDIANALHSAIQQGEFQVYYQPQLDLLKNCVVGMEALLRWQNEQLGSIPPDKFIPIVEEIGLINQIGNWVLYTACNQAKKWQNEFNSLIRVSVNFSPIQIAQEGVSDSIRAILKKTELSPSFLCIEITEKVLLQSSQNTIETLRDLRKMGVRIAIDDFGTGYSGLEYLSTFPCNIIKLDRVFVQNIHQHYVNQKIVMAVMNMSHDLNLKVVAEGAETEEELNYLKMQGCDAVQGYVYAKPMPAQAATEFVKSSLYSSSMPRPSQ